MNEKQAVRLHLISGDSITIEAISLPDLNVMLNSYSDHLPFKKINSSQNVYVKPDSVVAFEFTYEY